jgi:hypothetical protein
MPIRRAKPTWINPLVVLAETRLFGYREQIETELVISQSNLTWLETRPDQHRPEIAFAVIHFMIVYLDFRTEAKPECG